MKKYSPIYGKSFSCLAQNCPDTCCAGWQIPVDSKTLNRYKKINSETGVDYTRFIDKNEESEYVIRLVDNKCAFLDDDKLCRIHKKHGVIYTSEVCRQHPKFIEEYDGFTEISYSLSCPAAADLIFCSETNKNTYPKPQYDGKDKYLKCLIELRQSVFDEICKSSDLSSALYMLLFISGSFQDYCDFVNSDGEGFCAEKSYNINGLESFLSESDIESFIDALLTKAEILTDKWRLLLTEYKNSSKRQGFALFKSFDETSKMLMYFVYRYILKAVNNGEVYVRALFITLSVLACIKISDCTNCSFKEVARLYSKEIEHDTENIYMLYDYLQYLC